MKYNSQPLPSSSDQLSGVYSYLWHICLLDVCAGGVGGDGPQGIETSGLESSAPAGRGKRPRGESGQHCGCVWRRGEDGRSERRGATHYRETFNFTCWESSLIFRPDIRLSARNMPIWPVLLPDINNTELNTPSLLPVQQLGPPHPTSVRRAANVQLTTFWYSYILQCLSRRNKPIAVPVWLGWNALSMQ